MILNEIFHLISSILTEKFWFNFFRRFQTQVKNFNIGPFYDVLCFFDRKKSKKTIKLHFRATLCAILHMQKSKS